jgi:hypothetical protein
VEHEHRLWLEDERYYKWKNKSIKRPDQAVYRSGDDQQAVERIIGSRNTYYMSSLKGSGFPTVKGSLAGVRGIPPEMAHAYHRPPPHVFFWG